MSAAKRITIGTRPSLLSLVQTEEVLSFFRNEFPQYNFFLRKIVTLGDKINYWLRDSRGIFVKEIEKALLNKEIDLAVHSMKDIPTLIPPGLRLVAITKREDPRDVLLSKTKTKFFSLRKGTFIGTSSLRRAAQLLHWRPDIEIKPLRGNLDTRIRKLKETELDAIVVASAGISRVKQANKEVKYMLSGLYLDYLSPSIILPAAGQGALGLEARAQDREIANITSRINDYQTQLAVTCERAFLRELGGGCRAPIGALAQLENEKISLEVVLISVDGKRVIRLKKEAGISRAESLGKLLANEILKSGGREILKEINESRQGLSGRCRAG
jgi:hydroxymethylbilane synthase